MIKEMTNAIAERTPNGISHANAGKFPILNREQLDLAKRTVAKGLTDDEFSLYLAYCQSQNVSPMTKEVHAIKYGDQLAFVSSYHVMLAKVQATGQYEGMTIPLFAGKDGQWRDLWTEDYPPVACKIGVYRKGYREATYTIRYFAECMLSTSQWKRQPIQMLRKCAVADALRLAFDDVLHGVYIAEEMQPAGEVIDVAPVKQQPEKVVHAHPAYPVVSKDGWQNDVVPDAFLPTALRNSGITYAGLATDEKIQWRSERNGNTYTGRQLLHMWQTGKDQPLGETADILFAMYPSKKEKKESEENPPDTVTSGME